MTSGQYSFCLLLNADWLIQISGGLAVCKDNMGRIFASFFFFLGGGVGEGGGLLLGGLIFEEGAGLIILRYSPMRTCVRTC